MPNWKKLIVSGSDAALNTVTAIAFTGSLFGTSSFAISASYAPSSSFATSASFALTSSFPWFQTGSNIAYVGGNVFINTTSSAGFKLDVNGTGRFSGNLTITGSGTNSLLVKGSGTTTATTALLVQNSNATPSLTVKDDLTTTFGGNLFTANNSVISGSFGYSGGDFIKIHGLNTNGQAKIASYDYDTARTTELAFGSGDSHWRGLYKFSTNGYYLTDSVGSIASYERLTINYLGRVGISNPNPSYRLDVSGSGNFTSGLTVTGSLTATSITGSFTGSYTGSLFGTASYAISASYAPPSPGGGSQWTSSAADIYYNLGNVGINTTTPAYNLDVSGSAIVRTKLRVGNVGSNGTIHSATATTANVGNTVVWTESGVAGAAAFLEYYTIDTNLGVNQRAGNIIVTWNSAGIPRTTFTDTHTPDIGSNPQIAFSSSLSVGGDPEIYMINTSPDNYYIVINYRLF